MRRFIPLTCVAVALLLNCNDAVVRAEDAKPVTYDDHVAAIFKRHCLQCHGDSKQEAGLNLASYATAIKGSSGGAVVIAGRSSASRLIKAITAENPDERMPPDNDPLPKDQIATIKSWIDAGLRQNAGSAAAPTRALGFTPQPIARLDGPPPMPGRLPAIDRAKTVRPFPVLALAASPRAPLVVVASYECIDFIDPATHGIIGSVAFAEGEPHVLRFNRSGSVLLAAGGRPVQNGAAVLFDVKTGKRLAEIGNETDAVIAADLSADERQIAIGGSGRVVKVFSTADGSLLRTLVKHTDWITAMAFSPDGKLLATGDRIGNIHLWDAASGGVVLPLSEHKGAVRSLAWRSDSQVLASCGEDGLIVWWDVSKGWPTTTKSDAHPPRRPAGVYGKIANGVLDAAFGSKGELITCGRDRTVRLWAADGQPRQTFALDADGQANPASPAGIRILPTRVALTFDGATAIAGDSAGRVHTWPIEPGK
ncbi:MAG TPA: c-type cytochrome domain-containing protein [Planctomycetaceae bacterium]|jgi:mono/diheme cytochrome c family protein